MPDDVRHFFRTFSSVNSTKHVNATDVFHRLNTSGILSEPSQKDVVKKVTYLFSRSLH